MQDQFDIDMNSAFCACTSEYSPFGYCPVFFLDQGLKKIQYLEAAHIFLRKTKSDFNTIVLRKIKKYRGVISSENYKIWLKETDKDEIGNNLLKHVFIKSITQLEKPLPRIRLWYSRLERFFPMSVVLLANILISFDNESFYFIRNFHLTLSLYFI